MATIEKKVYPQGLVKLIEWLMAYESKDISFKGKQSSSKLIPNLTSKEDIKDRIKSFINENKLEYDINKIKDTALNYLTNQERISQGVNSSYTTLKKRIISGVYDFDFRRSR
jgi:hypothetical protein